MARKSQKADEPIRPGEFELIERYFAPLAGEGAFGLKDDAALVSVTPGKALVVTQDALAAGVHFLADDPPDLIARKALRVNLSDLAAKGAVPKAFSLALGLDGDWDAEWVAAFARGLGEDCAHYRVALTGGDTFRAPGGPVISVAAWGEIDAPNYRSRLGAGDGDTLFVTGTIGDGAIGLLAHQGRLPAGARDDRASLARSYLLPDPPVRFAPLIAEFASAAMDISDGFVGDLQKLAAASRVDFDVRAGDVPVAAALRGLVGEPGMLETALTGGDDYQFLFTVPQRRVAQFLQMAQKTDTAVAALAIARKGTGKVRITDATGEPMRFSSPSWNHF